jgi:hypothetical protein
MCARTNQLQRGIITSLAKIFSERERRRAAAMIDGRSGPIKDNRFQVFALTRQSASPNHHFQAQSGSPNDIVIPAPAASGVFIR